MRMLIFCSNVKMHCTELHEGRKMFCRPNVDKGAIECSLVSGTDAPWLCADANVCAGVHFNMTPEWQN